MELGGKIYCNPCTEKLVANRDKGSSWFERHLNWTENLSWIVWLALVYLATDPFLRLIIPSILAFNPDIGEKSVLVIVLSLEFIIMLAWILPINGWILKKKKKSLWNLLWVFIVSGLGFALGSLGSLVSL